MGIKTRSKKAIFFSTDALIAVLIILLVVLTAYPVLKYAKTDTQIQYDLITTLSSLKIGEVQNAYVQSLISSGVINNTNKTVLEQIGEFYITDLPTARQITSSVLTGVNTNKNVGIWYGNTLIYSINTTPIETAENIKTARQIISGIKEGESVTGFSARAFLSSNLRRQDFYFGGYVGEGNITAKIDYEGNISSAKIELAINKDFDLYINNNYSGTYTKSADDFTPVSYTIPTGNFTSGENLVELRGDNLHIAGGFITITFHNSVQYEQPEKYTFPGVNGLINIYDSFHIPGDLNSMGISLHINSPYNLFLTIENKTVFNNYTEGEETITIPNSELSSILDYNSISRKTIPIRLGLENVSYLIVGIPTYADVFSVTDLSGSMGGSKITQAISANRLLVDAILNLTNNRMGLVGYEEKAPNEWFHKLSNDNESLNNKLDEYIAGGSTCICCGVNRAIKGFTQTSIINQSDGIVSSRIYLISDDAEEIISTGQVITSSSSLEMTYFSYYGNQTIGLRFPYIEIPKGANIISAYIEFTATGSSSGSTNLTFYGEDTDNAHTFTTSNYDISSRQKTTAKLNWNNIPSWSNSHQYQTPDMSSIIQEIVNRDGWFPGNNMAIIVNGTGTRTARSAYYTSSAPLLVINFTISPSGCGDGNLDAGEECDDGNSNNNDNCTNLCTVATCSDGILWNQGSGSEQCDDGGTCTGDSSTFCLNDDDCASAGGTCAPVGNDSCSNTCQLVSIQPLI